MTLECVGDSEIILFEFTLNLFLEKLILSKWQNKASHLMSVIGHGFIAAFVIIGRAKAEMNLRR